MGIGVSADQYIGIVRLNAHLADEGEVRRRLEESKRASARQPFFYRWAGGVKITGIGREFFWRWCGMAV
jgi:hypothetical protein